MSGRTRYAGYRSVFRSGDSIVVSLPAKELEREGYDPEDLVDGDDVHARIENGEFRVDLES